jgi:aryl-alcohol dehydrogenase-like predicted oxidoreductase
MKYLHFAPLRRDLSQLALGSMVFSTEDLARTYALLDAWVKAGGNVVDTAHVYQGGDSERALGRWLADRGGRDRLTIIGKGAHPNADRTRVTPEDIACDLRDSLARLSTDSIDLYLLHRDDLAVPVGPIVEALNEHLRAGRIRSSGVSNWTIPRIEEANAYARGRGLEGFSASSPHLSLAVPNEPVWPGCVDARDAASLHWYARSRMPLFAWSSQARGFFILPHSPGEIANPTLTRVYDHPDNWARLQRAGELGRRKGGYSAVQVALAWVLHQPLVVYPIVGPHTVDELNSCVQALEIELTEEEVRWLAIGDGPG